MTYRYTPNLVDPLLAAIDERRKKARATIDVRLCQAHKDIVGRYEAAVQENDADPDVRAMAQASALSDVIVMLARGYGLEDGETK